MNKNPLQSKTVLGAIISLISASFALAGHDLDKGSLTELVTAIGITTGWLLTIYGRWKATGKLSF